MAKNPCGRLHESHVNSMGVHLRCPSQASLLHPDQNVVFPILSTTEDMSRSYIHLTASYIREHESGLLQIRSLLSTELETLQD